MGGTAPRECPLGVLGNTESRLPASSQYNLVGSNRHPLVFLTCPSHKGREEEMFSATSALVGIILKSRSLPTVLSVVCHPLTVEILQFFRESI